MSSKEKLDVEDLWERAQKLIKNGEVHSWYVLAERLGVKRTSVREAFVRLHGLGVVNDLFKKKVRKEDAGEEGDREFTQADYSDEYINIVCASKRITTVDMALKHFKIDLSTWQVDRFRVKTSEGYRKDRQVEWEVEEGRVKKGKVSDSGKMLVVPMFHISVTLKRKTQEVRARMAALDLIRDARRYAPKYAPMKYKRVKAQGLTLEVDFPDIHFGKHAWAEESGADYNLEIAHKTVMKTMDALLGFVRDQPVGRIILPMGNDFFNVDGKENTTSHGTPQQEDTRWNRTFREGRKLAVEMIDRCMQVAPVDVVMVPGNHDEERAFYLGEALFSWYHNARYVSLDISAKKRKYHAFGRVLLGFTHGYWEKVERLPSLMPLEEPQKWAGSVHREFHLGHRHSKKDLQHRTEDLDGVTIRWLRSLSPADVWHFDKGYVGSPRSAEAFLWHAEDGLVAQFQQTLKPESK